MIASTNTRAAATKPSIGYGRHIAATLSAVLLGLIFLASGLWKVTDLPATAERMVQLLTPPSLSLPGAILVAGSETLAGVLLLIPSCRRWGAWLACLLLLAFMAYMGIFYNRLIGEDCSCFPWVKRVVGPAFFAGDAAMLALAALTAVWSRQLGNLRKAVFSAAAVFTVVGVAYAVTVIRQSHPDVPETVLADGRPFQLRSGRVLLYFFDPQCTHCEAIARRMAKWNWTDTHVVALPTAEPQYAASFLKDTGLHAEVCLEADRLRTAAPFTTPPHAIVLDRGKVIGRFNFLQLEEPGFLSLLRRSGHVR
jgi:uncharacterized membrane protein YphA (DoxX/SURF4 family)